MKDFSRGLPLSVGWRVLALIALASVIEVLLFAPYFIGAIIPPFDFLGGYFTSAYQWWAAGGFLTPVEWVPHSWAGYPAALDLQDSAWYLPVGIASLFGPYTLWSAAVVSALHVLIGFAGTYLLVRSLGHGFGVSAATSTAAMFAVGYFSNAEHIDIVRGYALIPWLLLILSPKWPWARLWAVPVAAFIVWQAATGLYPGMVVAMVYVGLVWVVVWQWRTRLSLRAYLAPLAVSVVAAVLLSLPRLLPYALVQESVPGGPGPDSSEFDLAMVGTLLFGYSSPELPNDISMRSFFIPAAILALAFFARFRDSTVIHALSILVPAAFLGLPFLPWFTLVQALPGLGLSRFTMSDFKPFLVLGVLLLAATGLTALLRREPGAVPRRMWGD